MKNYIILLLTLFLFASCQKEATSNLSLIENQLKTDNTSSSEFILKNDTIINGKLGSQIFIPKDLFANYTNGIITFELKEFFSKEDMILNGLSTITDKDELLESSGMLYINFTEEGKQLAIKKGKKYSVKLPNEILGNSNLYSNDTDSIFKWKYMEPIIRRKDTTISDVVKNYKFRLSNLGPKGEGGFFKDVVISDTNTIDKIRKEDSLEIVKIKKRKKIVQSKGDPNLSEFDFGDPSFGDFTEADTTLTTEQIQQNYKTYQKLYDFDTFASSKLGWINCDKVLNVEKEITLQLSLKNHKNITHFSVYYIYKNYKTFLKDSYPSTPSFSKNFKVSGRTKVVVMSTTNDTYLYDVFYVNKDSKTNFEINLKETTLDNLKKVLITQ